jgi:hypothetical protein
MAMKLLLRCLNSIEAHHRANLLRAAGIRAEVRNTHLAGAVGDIPFIEAGPQVWIDGIESAERAREVLAQADAAPVQPAWRCECGECIEGQFAQCWNCGRPAPADG